MKIAVLTFDAFNELDSFVSAALLNRMSGRGWCAYITGATDQVTSRNGVVVEAQKPLEFATEADAVIFGSAMKTDEIAQDPAKPHEGRSCSPTSCWPVLRSADYVGSRPVFG
jgi:hypothetical protein